MSYVIVGSVLALDVVLSGVVGGLDAVVLVLAAVAEHDLVDGGLVLGGQHGGLGKVQVESSSGNVVNGRVVMCEMCESMHVGVS